MTSSSYYKRGPTGVVRYNDISPQMFQRHSNFTVRSDGLLRPLWGLRSPLCVKTKKKKKKTHRRFGRTASIIHRSRCAPRAISSNETACATQHPCCVCARARVPARRDDCLLVKQVNMPLASAPHPPRADNTFQYSLRSRIWRRKAALSPN